MDEELLLQRQIVGLEHRRGGSSSDFERKWAPGAAASSGGRMVGIRRSTALFDFMWSGCLREVRKRHSRGLLAAVEREAARRLRGKEAELEEARLRSAALEDKVRLLSAEGQMWVAAARHHEAAVPFFSPRLL